MTMSKIDYTFPTPEEIRQIERRASQLRADTVLSWTQAAFKAVRPSNRKRG